MQKQLADFDRILVCGFALIVLHMPAVTLAQTMDTNVTEIDEGGERQSVATVEDWQGPTLRIRGRIFGSFESIELPDRISEGDRHNDYYLRRADITIRGSLLEKLDYYLKTEFKDGDPEIRDAYFAYDAGFVTVRVGFLDPIDELVIPAYREFMEVSTAERFPPNNQLGIGVSHEGDNWTFFAAALEDTIEGLHFEKAGTLYSTRFTMAPPVPEGYLLHIGGYASWRKADDDEELFRYSARSLLRTGERFVDTGAVANKERLFGIELVGSIGSFSLESQCAEIRASLPSGPEPDSYLNGCYFAGIWNISGEMRNYSDGGFSRIKVDRPFFKGGPGTWQTGLRYETVDLSNGAIQGGGQDTWVFALNWYLSNQFWISGNYGRTEFKNNAFNGDGIDGLGVRLQFQFEW